MINDFVVVNHHIELIKYVDALQRQNVEQLSFYPLSCFETEERKNRLFLALYNNQPCGYLYVGAFLADLKIHQVCIQYDLRRRLYGAELIGYIERLAISKTCRTITLRCGFDIEANDFWSSLGYKCISIVDGGIRRQRRINVWRKFLSPSLGLDEFYIPERGKTNSSLWSKTHSKGHRHSQFIRGKSLLEYSEDLKKRLVESDIEL